MGSRRTKIVATIGPRTRDPESLRAILEAGVDVVRLNFAHDRYEVHERVAQLVREQAEDLGRVVGVLVDLPGPKMRTGPIAAEEVTLESGAEFTLTEADVEGDASRVGTTVEGLAKMVAPGDEVSLANGEIVLKVVALDGGDVRTEVLRGGVLRSRKGMHLPKGERQVEAFTPEDKEALEAALELKADLVGLSFVRDPEDVGKCRATLPKRGYRPLIVAKIETASAVDCLQAIVMEADAVMVARGDLGIQTPLERVPLLQKEIIRTCNEWGRPVITATEMLESMTDSPLPTRAEVTDIANAVLDGTDALMLSEETAVGSHPVLAVRTMARIAAVAESQGDREDNLVRGHDEDRVSWAVAHAAVLAAEDLSVAALLCPTITGSTPRRVAAFRPTMPIVGVSARRETLGALALVWGVIPLTMPVTPDAYEQREDVERVTGAARDAGVVGSGDLVAVVAGSAGPRAGRTDFVRIVRA
jgi:pyruvate kinase